MAAVDATARSAVFTRLAAVALVRLVGLLRAADLGDIWLLSVVQVMMEVLVATWLLLRGTSHESIEDGRQRGLGRYAVWLPRATLLDACVR